MPLRKGKSLATMRGNIGEILRSHKRSGKIGNITPKNKKHAQKIAVAIAARKAGRSKRKRRRRKK